MDGRYEALRLMHAAVGLFDVHLGALVPLVVAGHDAVDGGLYETPHGKGGGDAPVMLKYWHEELRRHLVAYLPEDLHKVKPEEVVEVLLGLGGMLLPVPPVPVSALG